MIAIFSKSVAIGLSVSALVLCGAITCPSVWQIKRTSH